MSQVHDSGEQPMTQVRVERSHVRRQRAFEEPRIVRGMRRCNEVHKVLQ